MMKSGLFKTNFSNNRLGKKKIECANVKHSKTEKGKLHMKTSFHKIRCYIQTSTHCT